ncbi:MAG: hypothetical protein WCH57_12535, partial [Verrucomicrobiota bacterium]
RPYPVHSPLACRLVTTLSKNFLKIGFSGVLLPPHYNGEQKTGNLQKDKASKKPIRHHSRRYYARAFANGKENWKSLKTPA